MRCFHPNLQQPPHEAPEVGAIGPINVNVHHAIFNFRIPVFRAAVWPSTPHSRRASQEMGLYSFAKPRIIASRIKAGRINEDWAVVDVRDTDFIGGHIPGCHHIPSVHFSEKCGALIEQLKDVKCVIFHCALSQQRGPTAAKLYAHRREDGLVSGSLKSSLAFGEEARARGAAQEVIILEGGFKGWAEEFKQDKTLVEGYNPALW
ncbi:hypothetical protein PCANC_03925 [Puccinia coronata f. sp. avenae]|uniref:Rhodanese domain-containing protein n=1 Tax=Puccinia coronata f. sp. avenae TaxID=200324 RepID=A0A2N5SSA4_9BASI|nr:hypothetical protein PCANC_17168 [Puccinia coronata f. sp. avenae]PLW56045.1 hypothetical protein PCANC_03925 [Puccinia coronata f. sp. avenae]